MIKTFQEFITESKFVDSKGKELETGWYIHTGSRRKRKIYITSISDTGIKYKEQNSDEVWSVSKTVFDSKYKGYLTKA